MTDEQSTSIRSASGAEAFGHDVLGPIVAEFCLRLWTVGELMDSPDQNALLFCARGGLRIHHAYLRFLAASALPTSPHSAPLMVSRLVSARGSITRALDEGRDDLLPAAATTLGYEFESRSTREAAQALTGAKIAPDDPTWDGPFKSPILLSLLRDPAAAAATESIREQEALFTRHLRAMLAGRTHAVLVDTGFYGTTRELLAEGHPEINVGSALLARSMRPGYPTRARRTTGLLLESADYVPLRRRTALLRNWHFVEWIFEPPLPSVRSFGLDDTGSPRSNLEVPGWERSVLPLAGSPFFGVISYLDALPAVALGARIAADSERAWRQLHRAIVFPDQAAARALAVTQRTYDFGREGAWSAREWRGPLAALRGSTIWREGEIARAGTRLRVPLLAAIESGYAVRYAARRLRVALGRDGHLRWSEPSASIRRARGRRGQG